MDTQISKIPKPNTFGFYNFFPLDLVLYSYPNISISCVERIG
ncbi:hypothetical protein LEP1GSC097_0956 [Leptospira interrogans serovar Grippotyphosa str. UI 08368]|nr:hypothetical protein LEP1GSC097_0956 [Leptospira interrogans serovar Grippotyphosa str. UI 08368]